MPPQSLQLEEQLLWCSVELFTLFLRGELEVRPLHGWLWLQCPADQRESCERASGAKKRRFQQRCVWSRNDAAMRTFSLQHCKFEASHFITWDELEGLGGAVTQREMSRYKSRLTEGV